MTTLGVKFEPTSKHEPLGYDAIIKGNIWWLIFGRIEDTMVFRVVRPIRQVDNNLRSLSIFLVFFPKGITMVYPEKPTSSPPLILYLIYIRLE